MDTSRRGFFKRLGAAAGVSVAVPFIPKSEAAPSVSGEVRALTEADIGGHTHGFGARCFATPHPAVEKAFQRKIAEAHRSVFPPKFEPSE